ncbi:hypothetical protein TWF730_003502 [Orbilia blumenaviensis]|uniref:Uncharacterized protein n=1 Tax=Orbilia blumenaviensis TaxID=1796055 RepID=A0AAV9U6I0_9PEZI
MTLSFTKRLPVSLVTSLRFSSDGSKLVSVSEENAIHLWDIFTGTLLQTFVDEEAMHRATYTDAYIRRCGDLVPTAFWEMFIWNGFSKAKVDLFPGIDAYNFVRIDCGPLLATSSVIIDTKLNDFNDGLRVVLYFGWASTGVL